jgi:peptide-methionine (S)-S-oxide reductase
MSNDGKNLTKIETAVLGGGCFWCLEAAFSRIRGVRSVVSGYAGGNGSDPTYEKVSSGKTGHAEVVRITYDAKAISYEDLLRIFFSLHDPTTPDRQGNDIGPQYRSIILYCDERQKNIAGSIRSEIGDKRIFNHPIITEIEKLEKFYPAEDYHQKYLERNPNKAYCRTVIAPKLGKLREKYSKYYGK